MREHWSEAESNGEAILDDGYFPPDEAADSQPTSVDKQMEKETVDLPGEVKETEKKQTTVDLPGEVKETEKKQTTVYLPGEVKETVKPHGVDKPLSAPAFVSMPPPSSIPLKPKAGASRDDVLKRVSELRPAVLPQIEFNSNLLVFSSN